MPGPSFKLQVLTALHAWSVLGPWPLLPVFILASIFFIPGPLMGLAAGAMFGTAAGFLLQIYSLTISAAVVFLAGRYFSRGWMVKKIEANPKMRAVDEAVTQGGWKMVALLRMTSVLPFSVMNYGLGLSKIPFRHYILATWFAMLPGSLLYAYLGDLAGEIVFEGRKPQRTMIEWVFFAVGTAVTIGVGIYATKRARQILANK